MTDLRQKNHLLTQIIKTCKHTQSQLTQLKRTLYVQSLFDGPAATRHTVKQIKSISLLKSSRVHIEQYEKRQGKMSSFQVRGKYEKRREVVGQEGLGEGGVIRKNERNERKGGCEDTQRQEMRKFRKVVSKQHAEEEKDDNGYCQKQTNLLLTEINHKHQSLSSSLHYNNNTQPLQRSPSPSSKPVPSPSSSSKPHFSPHHHLPSITTAYCQTFSPKNASLSQYTLAERLLSQSIYKKSHQARCRKYNKENMMKEYERSKYADQEKLENYRLGILKKISYENVKKYLFSKMQKKERIGVIQKEQRAACRVFNGEM